MEGWRGGREREERYVTLLHLQTLSNLVKAKLYFNSSLFCLFVSFNLPNSFCHFSLPPLWPQCFSPHLFVPLFFFSNSASLSLFVLSSALSCLTSLPYLFSSFWQDQQFYYPTSPLPGWVRYCSGEPSSLGT